LPNRRLAAFTIFALILIEIATVASHWGDVKARRPDFASLYSSAQLMREGKSTQAAQPTSETTNSGENQQIGMRPDTLHPPFETALFVPLSFFSYTTAYVIWLGCNLVMVWAVPILLWAELGILQREFHFIAIVYGSMYPVLVCLVQGQDAILLLLLLTVCYRALMARREPLAGVLLALALFKFQIVIPIALLFMAAKKWKVIAGFAGTASVLAIASVALIGVRNAINYATFVFHLGLLSPNAASDDPSLMPNLRGLLINVFGRILSPAAIIVAVIVISMFVLALAAKTSFEQKDEAWSLRYALFVLVGCVISYHFFPHNASVLLLPILLSANRVLSEAVPVQWRWTFAAAVLAIYLGPNLLPLGVAMPLLGCAAIVLMTLLAEYKRLQPSPTLRSQ
jgi:hypothetical protein